MSEPQRTTSSMRQRNRALGIKLGLGAAVMIGLAFVSVPLYSIFCQKTGYGGATQVASKPVPEDGILDRKVTIRFNADVAPGLDWAFKPAANEITVNIGEVQKILFEVTNKGKANDTGVAVYNVQPDRAGLYFNKIQCFCFDNQPLKAGEKETLPVQFFVDPSMATDPQMNDVKTITLSYTFFASKSASLSAAQKKFELKQSELLETAKTIP